MIQGGADFAAVLSGVSKPQPKYWMDFHSPVMLSNLHNTIYSITFIIQSLKSHSTFQPETQRFKIKAKKDHCLMCICNKSYIRFRMSICLLLLLWPSLCATLYLSVKSLKYFVRLCLCSSYFVFFFTFTEKCHCDKVNHLVSMVSITAILVRLLQMIWCYVTRFAMNVSVLSDLFSVSSKDMHFTS